jgi:hypothetical protein
VLEAIGQDLRHAARTLRRTPGVSLLIVVTLATVMAATTSIFSLANALLLPSAGRLLGAATAPVEALRAE